MSLARRGSSPRIRGKCYNPHPLVTARRIIPANTGKMLRRWRRWVSTRDHPREYGENFASNGFYPPDRGSSPRIRGKCAIMWLVNNVAGIIPANTGKMLSAGQLCPGKRDHPREYGENQGFAPRRSRFQGSSPRIRGKCRWLAQAHSRRGIIPANTGKITTRRLHLGFRWDHPREYGENDRVDKGGNAAVGSSPRIRGKSCSGHK